MRPLAVSTVPILLLSVGDDVAAAAAYHGQLLHPHPPAARGATTMTCPPAGMGRGGDAGIRIRSLNAVVASSAVASFDGEAPKGAVATSSGSLAGPRRRRRGQRSTIDDGGLGGDDDGPVPGLGGTGTGIGCNNVNGGATTTTSAPSVIPSASSMAGEVLSLGLPALGGMLIDPIMSLVDTACVGQVSSVQLAALAPCASVCQFAIQSFWFLGAATTNLIASSPTSSSSAGTSGASETSRRRHEAEVEEYRTQIVSSAAVLALLLGVSTSALLLVFAEPLLTLAGCPSPSLLAPACSYLRIRALGLPFVLLATALQGASLGAGDARTPLTIFAAAGLLNLAGDAYLTLHRGWGVRGAAVATVASQIAAAMYYAVRSTRGARTGRRSTTGTSRRRLGRSTDKAETTPPPQQAVGPRLEWRTGFRPPPKRVARTYLTMALTLLARQVSCMTAYSLTTRAAGSTGSPVTLAAHQVALQVWWLLSYLPEAFTVAAQTLVARDRGCDRRRVSRLVRVLYGLSAASGGLVAVLTFASLATPRISKMLVADGAVRDALRLAAPLAASAQCLCSVACLSDGICVGLGQYGHLPFTMLGAAIVAALGLGSLGGGSVGIGIGGIWACMNVFFVARLVPHLLFSGKLRGFLLGGVNLEGRRGRAHSPSGPSSAATVSVSRA